MTLGVNDAASCDDGNMGPISFAPKTLSSADEHRIGALVKWAVG